MSDDDESRNYLFTHVEQLVRAGFEDEDEVLEGLDELVEDELGDADEELVAELTAHARRLFGEQRIRQDGWTEPTVNDAIDRAFDELNERGIVALQNAGYTVSEGRSDVNEVASEMSTPPRGATFYHGQDLERVLEGGGLALTFGAFEDDPAQRDSASVAVGREVVDTLTRHGVPVQWNGDVTQRLEIPPFEWRKRR
jgi:hypothetical protein